MAKRRRPHGGLFIKFGSLEANANGPVAIIALIAIIVAVAIIYRW